EAIECDVDGIGELSEGAGNGVGLPRVPGDIEHIAVAGSQSGDSACAIPPYSLPADVVDRIKVHARNLAKSLRVRGLMNVQFAIKRPDPKAGTGHEIYVLE